MGHKSCVIRDVFDDGDDYDMDDNDDASVDGGLVP